jgi:thiamine-phosphate pyrophosphorylase
MIERFGLYVILTDPVVGYEACAHAAVEEGIRYLQLRMKNQPREVILSTAKTIRQITAGTNTRFIVNDDVAIAASVDADGVHLGQHDLDLESARTQWPVPGKIFGLSTHSLEQARAAWALKPDYIGVGPVFPTPTKAIPDPVLGVETMGQIIRQSPVTTVAIGGIDESNLSRVLENGAINFCAVRAITQSPDPRNAIRCLKALSREQALK